METCPECGMDVPRLEAFDRSRFDGEIYYFCSKACRDAFERDPARFIGVAAVD